MIFPRPLIAARRRDDNEDEEDRGRPDRGPQRRPSEGGGELPEMLRGLSDLFRGRSGGTGGGGSGPSVPGVGGIAGFRWGRIAPFIVLIVVVGYLATGIYVVNPGEQGIVRQAGNVRFAASKQVVDTDHPRPARHQLVTEMGA